MTAVVAADPRCSFSFSFSLSFFSSFPHILSGAVSGVTTLAGAPPHKSIFREII